MRPKSNDKCLHKRQKRRDREGSVRMKADRNEMAMGHPRDAWSPRGWKSQKDPPPQPVEGGTDLLTP